MRGCNDINIQRLDSVFTLHQPIDPFPLFIDSPHSGRVYPQDFDYICPFYDLSQAEDNHLETLLDGALTYGATMLQAEFPRSYIDVNRAADDIDTALLSEKWPEEIYPSPRSEAGIGLIRRLVKPGIPVYNRALSVEEIKHRLNTYYHPYHQVLSDTLDHLHYHFGQVWHLNMHSMPAASARMHDGTPVDFVLGDLNGTTCRRDFVFSLKGLLEGMGYRVSLNDPYKGVELIARTAQPSSGRNSLQIEINKNLYWNEKEGKFLPQREKLITTLNQIFEFTAYFIEKELVPKAAD